MSDPTSLLGTSENRFKEVTRLGIHLTQHTAQDGYKKIVISGNTIWTKYANHGKLK